MSKISTFSCANHSLLSSLMKSFVSVSVPATASVACGGFVDPVLHFLLGLLERIEQVSMTACSRNPRIPLYTTALAGMGFAIFQSPVNSLPPQGLKSLVHSEFHGPEPCFRSASLMLEMYLL